MHIFCQVHNQGSETIANQLQNLHAHLMRRKMKIAGFNELCLHHLTYTVYLINRKLCFHKYIHTAVYLLKIKYTDSNRHDHLYHSFAKYAIFITSLFQSLGLGSHDSTEQSFLSVNLLVSLVHSPPVTIAALRHALSLIKYNPVGVFQHKPDPWPSADFAPPHHSQRSCTQSFPFPYSHLISITIITDWMLPMDVMRGVITQR